MSDQSDSVFVPEQAVPAPGQAGSLTEEADSLPKKADFLLEQADSLPGEAGFLDKGTGSLPEDVCDKVSSSTTVVRPLLPATATSDERVSPLMLELCSALGVTHFQLTPDPVLMSLGKEDEEWEPPSCPRFDSWSQDSE